MYVSRSGLLTFMFAAVCAFLYATYAIVIEPDYMVADKYHYSGDNVTYYDTNTENYEIVDYDSLPSGVKTAYDDFLEKEQSQAVVSEPSASTHEEQAETTIAIGSAEHEKDSVQYQEGSDVHDRFQKSYDRTIYFTDDAGRRYIIHKK